MQPRTLPTQQRGVRPPRATSAPNGLRPHTRRGLKSHAWVQPAQALGTSASAAPMVQPEATPEALQSVDPPQANLAAVLAGGVQATFNSLNQRDMQAVASCLANNVVYQNLAEGTNRSGRDQVLSWYRDLIGMVPQTAKLCIDDLSVSQEQSMVDVTWHVELAGVMLPLSRGTSIYWLDATGRVTRIRDSTEVPMAVAVKALSFASPAIDAAAPLFPPLQEALSLPGYVVGIFNPQSLDASGSNGSSAAPPNLLASAFSGVLEQALPVPLSSLPFVGGWPAPAPQVPQRPAGSSSTTSSSSPAASTSAAAPANPSSTSNRVAMRPLPHSSAATGQQAASARATPSSSAAASAQLKASGMATPQASSERQGVVAMGAVRTAPTVQPTVSGSSMGSVSEDVAEVANFSGVWSKDLEASDAAAYEAMMDLLGLTGLQRVTARLIEGIEIKHVQGKSFDVSYLTVVPFFRVTESSLIGYQTSMMRRDLRPGNQRAVAEELPEGGVRVSFAWSEPNAGALQETYVLEGNRMSVLCSLAIGNRKATVVMVYKRMEGGSEELLRESRKRNSSLDSVLARQKAQFGWK